MTPEENQRFQTLEKLVVSLAECECNSLRCGILFTKIALALKRDISSLVDDQIERLRIRASSEAIPDGPEKRKLLSFISSRIEQPKDQSDAKLAKLIESQEVQTAAMLAKVEETLKLFRPITSEPPTPT